MDFSTKTEVIDLVDSNVVCKDLDNFPIEGLYGSAGANLVSMPIICGGRFYKNGSDHTSDKCFMYKEGGWEHFATMIDRRAGAAGIVYDNTFHIFGGSDENTRLQSSEIVKEDGSSVEGPQLPKPIHSHAVASINATVSIITGGYTGTYSEQTWYFNHASQEFQAGPNLLKGRNYLSSGTITDQKTKEKTVIVVGGYHGSPSNGIYMDSTEILLNEQWVTGKNYTMSTF